MSEKPARDWAADLVQLWIQRLPTDDVKDQIPELHKERALIHARNSCQLIQYWARVALDDGMDRVPRLMKQQVVEYWSYRKK